MISNLRRMLPLILFLSVALPAQAETPLSGKWELGPYVGAAFPDDYAPGGVEDAAPLAGLRFGHFFTEYLSAEASLQRAFGDTQTSSGADLDAVRFNLLLNLFPGHNQRPFLTGGFGIEFADVGAAINETDDAPNVGGGVRWILTPCWSVRVEGRYIPVKVGGAVNAWQHNYEATAGLSWLFGGKPAEKAPEPTPTPTPEATPEVTPTPEPTVVPTPEATPTAAPILDSDADGVPDEKDQCPGTPSGTTVDELGCRPKEAKARGVLKGVEFEISSDKLTDDSKKILDEAADALKEYPENKVEVQGHTDNYGDAGFNQQLSEKRAKSVMAYLVSKGLDAARFTAKGYGPDQPIADNKTRAGRKQNRRVELKWLDQ